MDENGLFGPKKTGWQLRIGGTTTGNALLLGPDTLIPPNRFYRFVQRWLLGLHWERTP